MDDVKQATIERICLCCHDYQKTPKNIVAIEPGFDALCLRSILSKSWSRDFRRHSPGFDDLYSLSVLWARVCSHSGRDSIPQP